MYHEFVLDRVAPASLSLGNEETFREEEHLSLLRARLTASLDLECVLWKQHIECVFEIT